MQSGIYDARGKLIETTVERIEEPQVPKSFELTKNEGGLSTLSYLASPTLLTGNYTGNILIRDSVGNVSIFIGMEE
ncbi:MAG: hypothetical protein GX638_18965 [Crenarchaeota archaeon]|jgi:hypothetical protein|nr:hypothetical protein [Thermoproteota archaeon]